MLGVVIVDVRGSAVGGTMRACIPGRRGCDSGKPCRVR